MFYHFYNALVSFVHGRKVFIFTTVHTLIIYSIAHINKYIASKNITCKKEIANSYIIRYIRSILYGKKRYK